MFYKIFYFFYKFSIKFIFYRFLQNLGNFIDFIASKNRRKTTFLAIFRLVGYVVSRLEKFGKDRFPIKRGQNAI